MKKLVRICSILLTCFGLYNWIIFNWHVNIGVTQSDDNRSTQVVINIVEKDLDTRIATAQHMINPNNPNSPINKANEFIDKVSGEAKQQVINEIMANINKSLQEYQAKDNSDIDINSIINSDEFKNILNNIDTEDVKNIINSVDVNSMKENLNSIEIQGITEETITE